MSEDEIRFKELQAVEQKVTEDIMGKFQTMFTQVLNSNAETHRKIDALELKIQPLIDLRITALKFGRFANWVSEHALKLLVALGTIAFAITQIWDFLKHWPNHK